MPLFVFASGYVYIATVKEFPLVLFCIIRHCHWQTCFVLSNSRRCLCFLGNCVWTYRAAFLHQGFQGETISNHIRIVCCLPIYSIRDGETRRNYLFHTTFEGFIKAVFRKLPLDTDLWHIFLAEAIVVITVGVIGPMLCFKIFKKYRLTKFLFGM